MNATSGLRFGRGSLSRFLKFFSFPAGRAFLVSSPEILRLHGEKVRAALGSNGVVELTIDDREVAKNLATVSDLLDRLIAEEVRRDDFIVSFGGGVVSDVAGFAAAIVLRGIAWFAIPTTLLAMADAAIGGKTGVDHPRGKNLIGAFHLPGGVLVDPELLATLPDRQFRSGLVEVYKVALLARPDLAAEMGGRLEAIAESRLADTYLEAAIEVKQAVVERDLREGGERRRLNLGHTLGHALEAAGGYAAMTHGEAVAIGLAATIEISIEHAGFDAVLARSLSAELVDFSRSATRAASLPESAIEQALAHDKKASTAGRMALLLEAAGRPIEAPIAPGLWIAALRRILRRSAV